MVSTIRGTALSMDGAIPRMGQNIVARYVAFYEDAIVNKRVPFFMGYCGALGEFSHRPLY